MADQNFSDQREFSRAPVHMRAEVSAGDRIYAGGAMESLSLKGGFYRIAQPPEAGTKVMVRLHLTDTDITIRARGVVIRQLPDGCGIQFTEIVGVDSLEHLRNLIRFNAEDPVKVEHEFDEHVGLKRPS